VEGDAIYHETYFISRHEERVERPGIKRPRSNLLCKSHPSELDPHLDAVLGRNGTRKSSGQDGSSKGKYDFLCDQSTNDKPGLSRCKLLESSKAWIESFVDGLAEEENDGMIM